MAKVIERFYFDVEHFHNSVENNISYLLSKAVQEQGEATFLVSGGSTPQPLYQSLSNKQLFWKQIQVAMVDEHWVSSEHETSNERFIRNQLLQNNAKDAKFQPMKTASEVAKDAEVEVTRAYSNLKTPFDVTVLGMGTDGHTASLFPKAKGLDKAVADDSIFCQSVQSNNIDMSGDSTERMSLTLNALKQSKIIFLLLRGREKLATYKKAVAGNDIFEMPVRAILQQNEVPVVVNWAP